MNYNKNSKDNKVDKDKTNLLDEKAKNQDDKNMIQCQKSDDKLSESIQDATDILTNINIIKDELCKLPLDPCEKEIYENNLFPMLNLLYYLSNVSVNLANSANTLTNSTIVFRKKSEIKDTINLVYDINKKCEKVYEVLEKRIDKFIY
ncbi:hypothetical protein CLHOM_13600 [Clostridium homopropionicum DSM 5847]|uniref:Uncharacterized protein n=1 Tax=Clostridium homopropionicum DSM 5847 TaxID=1121318 RepID=A0A0L6ZB10_9CLOT|nr:hypothetical protein [Clostridium homopropionicum]KOA20161.1 hypothetical protein CLHOM_13600 [Clostridium homopropionicum DSM 5847]SFG60824.1 hypothetical protein SAMN04488501_111115 [Clostridium homopropionicum]